MNLYAFLVTTLAGISTMIGAVIIFISKEKNNNIICGALSFAAGIMIMVSLSDLIPSSYTLLTKFYKLVPTILIIMIGINLGIILTNLIDKYIPNKISEKIRDVSLYRVGKLSMIAMIMHNIPEGIATFITTLSDQKLGLTLGIAIALHNIPEGISIALPIYYSTKNYFKALWYTFISGISELFGAILAFLFLSKYMTDNIMAMLYAIIAGIMMQISLTSLLPEAKKYNNRRVEIIFFLLGILTMIICHNLIN